MHSSITRKVPHCTLDTTVRQCTLPQLHATLRLLTLRVLSQHKQMHMIRITELAARNSCSDQAISLLQRTPDDVGFKQLPHLGATDALLCPE